MYSSYEQYLGYEAEYAIQEAYGMSHLMDDPEKIRYGRQQSTLEGIFKPDIVNLDRGTWLEIKPLSPSGVVTGEAKRQVYTRVLDPIVGRPEWEWIPPMKMTTPNGHEIYVFNAAGIIYYQETDIVEDTIEQLQFETVVTGYALLDYVFRKTPAKRWLQPAFARIARLSASSKAIDSARLKAHVGIAAMLATIGGI